MNLEEFSTYQEPHFTQVDKALVLIRELLEEDDTLKERKPQVSDDITNARYVLELHILPVPRGVLPPAMGSFW